MRDRRSCGLRTVRIDSKRADHAYSLCRHELAGRARSTYISPAAMACSIHGITSSSISSSDVVAAKPSTRWAFSVDGIRRCTSCSKGGSLT